MNTGKRDSLIGKALTFSRDDAGSIPVHASNNVKLKRKDMKFNIEIGDMGLVSMEPDHVRFYPTAKIVKHQTDEKGHRTHFVLAFWNANKDGEYSLEFCGARPFHENIKTFMTLAARGQDILEHLITNNDEDI